MTMRICSVSILLSLFVAVWAASTANAFVPSIKQASAGNDLSLRMSTGATMDTPRSSASGSPDRLDVVWMGAGDLRTDDHGGLQAAWKAHEQATRKNIVPIVVLENLEQIPGSIAHTIDTAAIVSSALRDLSTSLESSFKLHLHVFETYQDAWESLMNASSELHVHTCDLGVVDNRMGYGAHHGVLQSSSSIETESVQWHSWNCRLREEPWDNLDVESITEFPVYAKTYSNAPTQPLSAPQDESASEETIFRLDDARTVDVPSSEQLASLFQTKLQLESEQMEEEQNTGLYGTHWGGLDAASASETNVLEMLRVYTQECDEDDQVFSEHANAPAPIRNGRSLEHAAVSWMLRGKDGSTTRQNTQNMIAGEGMTRFLAMPLLLGTVSPRRIWYMAQKNDMWHTSPLRTLVETSEWHKLLAARNIADAGKKEGGNALRYDYWRWHGFLCRYGQSTLKESSTSPNKEGLVLVHGFGASSSQWDKAMEELRSGTNEAVAEGTVEGLAPDLIGFGQSEKPPLTYTQYLWESYVSAFVKEVAVHKQKWGGYVVGGNSIGGYTSMGTAADDTVQRQSSSVSCSGAPGTGKCKGVVLMNSAGQLKSREEIEKLRQDGRATERRSMADVTSRDGLPGCSPITRPVARLFGTGLLTYLRPRIQSICVNLYPTNPNAVDENLCDGILRDSLDPGAINVMISGSKLPPPRTANELLGADYGSAATENSDELREGMWTGPVLVAQGMKDPLNDAKSRAIMFGDLRENIVVKAIDAGHCPHDELPGDVSTEIVRWLESTKELRKTTVGQAETIGAQPSYSSG